MNEPVRAATLRRTLKEFKADRCTMAAGSLAYSWFLALVPALIAVLGVTSLIRFGGSAVHHLVSGINKVLPQGASEVFTQAVQSATSRTSHGSLPVIIIAVVIALWSASSGMVTLQTALDIAYDVPNERTFIAKRLRAIPLMLGTLIFGGIAAVLIVFEGPLARAIERRLSVGGTEFTIGWDVLRWLVAIALVSMMFSLYYFLGPNRQSPRWQWVSPGGVAGTVVFIAASVGLSFYVANFGTYARTYGALAGVVILMLWFYLSALAVLFGGELNAEIEREAPVGPGHPEAGVSATGIETGR